MSRVCQTDGSFGPGIGSCRGGFDFTLTFEDSILSLLPQVAFLLLAPLRFNTLRRRKNRVAKNSHLGFLKIVTSILYTASSIILLVLWSEIESYKTKMSIAANSFQFLSSLAIVTLSHLEHTRAVRPSHLLQFFLLVLLICDAVRLRTLFLMEYPTSLVTSASIHTFLTGLLLLLESLDKRELFYSDRDKALPPEETIGLFGQRLFWFLNGLFLDGYRKVLKPSDLFDVDQDLASEEIRVLFSQAWSKQDKTRKAPLSRVIFHVLWFDLVLPMIPRLLQIGTTLSQPYLISAMIKFIQSGPPESKNDGYGLIAAFALNYAFLAVFTSWHTQSVARFAVKLRGCLISLIYERTLDLDSKEVNLGSATVLMNVDVEKVLAAVRFMHEFWAQTISCGVALYILYTRLGAPFVSPLVTILIATAISSWVGKRMKARSSDWVAATERRVTSIAYATGAIKGIRMLGLSDTVLKSLTALREAEVERHRSVRKLSVWVTVISNVMFQLTTLSTYVTFAVVSLFGGRSLDVQLLFGSLSALKLVTTPLTGMLQIITSFQGGVASLERIQTYLKSDVLEKPTYTYRVKNATRIELQPIQGKRSHTSSSSEALRITHGVFEIEQNKPILSDINLTIPVSSFTMIIGKVASGKSVLLRSMLGETTVVEGSVAKSFSGGMAFCDQSTWLRNITLRENIIGEDTVDNAWYSSVTWACGLQKDFTELKMGDLTRIGSKGGSLSGGQRNRISLARALYARKPTIIIDDILSGLDNTTERLVFNRVFGPKGLLRKSRTTVVLATHSTHFAQQADKIVVMSAGRIVDQGIYAELASRKIPFHAFDAVSDIGSGSSEEVKTVEEDEKVLATVDATSLPDEGQEDSTDRRSGDMRSMLFFLSAVGKVQVSIYFALLACETVSTTMQNIYLKIWAESDTSTRSSMVRHLYTFIGVTILNIGVIGIWLTHFTLWFTPQMSLVLHSRQLYALMMAKFSILVSTDTGNVTNRFSQDIVLVDNQLQGSWINATSCAFLILSNVIILCLATPQVAACIPFLCAASYLIQRVYLRTSRQIRLMDLEAKAPLCTHFLETLAGIVTIRSFGWPDDYRRKNKVHLDQSQIPFYLLFAIQNWLNLVLELMVAGLITILVGLGVSLRSKVDAGYLGLALIGTMDLGFFIRLLVISWTDLETSLSAVARIRHFSKTPSEHQDRVTSDPPTGWPLTGSVQFKSLVASYTEEGKSVLHGVDLDIKAGEKIGLCGRTGSGKSSLVATLFGLLHHQSGSLLIDGVSTDSVALDVLRSKVTALPQEPFFLRGNVRHNLDPWQHSAQRLPVSDQEMKLALKRVELWDKLSNAAEPGQTALDVSLDHVDSLLSQGERQLFCLARAILMVGKIVVLDEATSSVDAATDRLMQEILRSAFADRTIIAIAHRLDTILDFDRVVVMDSGRIAEIGAPSKLLKTEGSLFKALVESQGKH
ncbi:P-loop containing nucleoside triphosphate hydrolase protein [Mytilinidion resinicola]|uniref:P-loop containing nucleoside triphosphate hydrolase protein n=1 Tax=Mytilinidion resinicola TaxID=574789 RepID=A0A6A6Z9Z6_9PEZI|nr:P-loop containing nucleoside triphosphate hydrolase protein [Mytilinidion resinicola]KAF2817519.1 P-loop containing nucleoside triphosphate hydrolase protein [Mytilinidion resinicola]